MEKTWLTIGVPIHLKVFIRIEVRVLCRPLEFFHTKLVKPCFMELALCTGSLKWWNRKGPSPNCCCCRYFI